MRFCCNAGERVHVTWLSKIEKIEEIEIYWWIDNISDRSNWIGDGRYDYLSITEWEGTYWR